MKLSDLQKEFVSAIVQKKEPSASSRLKLKRLEVYQAGYPARLTEALGETYEGIWSVLGDRLFFEVCEDFLRKCPSRSYNLSDYDPRFIEYIETRQDLVAEFGFLPELAAFEWDFHTLFHKAPDAVVTLDEATLAGVHGGSTFSFISTLSLYGFRYSTYRVWRQRLDEDRSPFDFSQPEQIAMFKVGDQRIKTLPLDPIQFELLRSLTNTVTLEQAIELASERHDVTEEAISGLFGILIQNQLLYLIA